VVEDGNGGGNGPSYYNASSDGRSDATTLECVCARLDQRLRGVELSLAALSRCMQQCHADMDERLARLEQC